MIFHTNGFLSKWGFCDGDLIDDILLDEFGFIKDLEFEHNVLIEVVQKHVLPKIKNKYEFYSFPTHHNPLRFSKVDGVDIDHLKGDENPVV